jgi:hypothetical protein
LKPAAFSISLALLHGGLLALSPPAVSATFSDDFSGSTLKSPWRRNAPLAGPQISVNNGLTIQVPSGKYYDEWLTVDHAPRVEILAPKGDFTVSAELKSSLKPNGQPLTGNFHSALSLDFGSGDHVYWGAFTSTRQLLMQRDGVLASGQASIPALPVWLQAVKKGSEFRFFYKSSSNAAWKPLTNGDGSPVLVKTTKAVKSIGLMQKTWSDVPGSATWASFSLESDEALPGCPVTLTDGNWCDEYAVLTSAAEADLMARAGDIDNLNIGWPSGFDPFSGESTPIHPFPWELNAADAPGTDRIMVASSFDGHPPHGQDGYSSVTVRPDNLPQPITLAYDPGAIKIASAVLQLFVDDFQAPVMNAHYQALLDGVRAPFLEDVINRLDQSGPIGKLITVNVPGPFLGLLSDGRVALDIDDPTTGAGDGFAIDFVKLLLNPKTLARTGTVTGRLTDALSGGSVAGATVVTSSGQTAQTDSNGRYVLEDVPAGLTLITVTAPGHLSAMGSADLIAGKTATLSFILAVDHLPFTVTAMSVTSKTDAAGVNYGGYVSQSGDPTAPFYGQGVYFFGSDNGGSRIMRQRAYLVYRYQIRFDNPVRLQSTRVDGAAFNGPDSAVRLLDADQKEISTVATSGGNVHAGFTLNAKSSWGQTFYLEEFDTSTTWRYRDKIIVNFGLFSGDLNGDGRANVQDATLALKIAVGLQNPTDAQKTAGDANGDGLLNVQDATLILKKAVGLP